MRTFKLLVPVLSTVPVTSLSLGGWPAKFEQIPLFYLDPRGGAAPLRGIAPIATLERFVVYCSACKQVISGARPRGHEELLCGRDVLSKLAMA